MNALGIIIRREYLERVTRKTFLITTILMPVLMLGMMVLPSLVMIFTGPENKTIAVIDRSGIVAPTLSDADEMQFVTLEPSTPLDSARTMADFDGILLIHNNIIDNPDRIELYTRGASSIQTESFITSHVCDVIETERIKRFEIENLAQIMADVKADVHLQTFRIDKEDAEATSSIVSYLIGLVMVMLLYMFLMIYGQMVMNSIIEEKGNRVLEIIVSSVKPRILMLGKIVGIGAVALTQVVIWGILIAACSRWLMPVLTAGITSDDMDLMKAITMLGDTGYILSLFGYIAVFLIFGYIFYSSIYAAIGSAVDNVQDASQLTTIALVPIMVGLIFSLSVANDPNSALAFWLSIIPFTSPMVMMARIPFGIPGWEIALSIALLVVCSLLMIWLAAKIYRVGIFMYGKKPSVRDLIRWARYK